MGALTHNGRIDFANTLRGFAAVLVMFSHYFGFFGPGREAIAGIIHAPALPLETHGVPSYLAWFFQTPYVSSAALGVALFFLISGFVIPFSLQKMSAAGFCISRVFRILPTYAAGFSITLLAIFVSTSYFSTDWPFSLREVLIHYLPGLRDLMWSPHIDFIVWTLEVEVKFYILCAIFISLFRQSSLKVFLVPVALLFVAVFMGRFSAGWAANDLEMYKLWVIVVSPLPYLGFMFIGVVFNYLYAGKINSDKAYLIVGSLFALFCVQMTVGTAPGNLVLAWSYGAALLVFSFAYCMPHFFRSNRVFDFLANISYPLYVIHGVAGYVSFRLMMDAGFKAWVSLIVVVGACFFVSWVIHILIERPSQIIGKRLASKFKIKEASFRSCVERGEKIA